MLAGAAACLLAGCGKSADTPPGKAGGEAAAAAPVSSAALCKLFTAGEAAAWVGPVTGTGTGSAAMPNVATCMWNTSDYRSRLTVTVVNLADNPNASQLPLKKARGFRLVPELGEDGFVENSGGWLAGVKRGGEFVSVQIASPTATADQAIAALREVIKRRG
jgi:hypothetical protein